MDDGYGSMITEYGVRVQVKYEYDTPYKYKYVRTTHTDEDISKFGPLRTILIASRTVIVD